MVDADDQDVFTRDAAVERAFAAGAPDALRLVWDRFGALVYTFCRRSLAADLVDDAVQEVFIAAWRYRERFDPERGRLAAWLMGIARHKVVDAMRASGRAPLPVDDVHDAVADDTTEAVATRMLVAHALTCLSPRAREVVELAYFEDLTHVEIANRCHLPLGTVKSDIRRGLERIREYLGDLDVVTA